VGDKSHIDPTIAQIASTQHGNVTWSQLLAAGVHRDAIRYRVKTGRLFPAFRGVYAVGRPPSTPLEKAATAVLACGDRSALSHGSAMTLWGFWTRWDQPFEVSVASDRRPKGIRVHRVAGLVQRDVRIEHGIRVTSPARTLLDKAPTIPGRSLTRFVNDGRRREILTVADIDDVALRFSLHPGAPLLRGQLTDQNPTRSGFENDFLSFCERFGLPIPRLNTMVHGYEADAYFEAEKLIVECDGWDFHNDRGAFEDDRERDAAMLALGIVTIRITKRRLGGDPAREAARLHAILADRRRLLAA
jgi:hypothetical protein